jgi:hypothetical protein
LHVCFWPEAASQDTAAELPLSVKADFGVVTCLSTAYDPKQPVANRVDIARFHKNMSGWVIPRMPMDRQSFLLLFSLVAVSACVSISSSGNSAVSIGTLTPSGEEEIVRGVVNGLYEYDPAKTMEQLQKYDEHLSPSEISEYSQRYVVKVGINREPILAALSPIVIAKWSDYVVLPAGWSHDLAVISDDAAVLNVGDVVDIRKQSGRRYDYVSKLVRKCNDPPVENENPDWNIGCKIYNKYNEQGFAGEFYRIRQF